MKSFPPPHSSTKIVRPTAPLPRPQSASTMRSTVLMSLLLSPDGGVETHRHGQGSPRPRS
ncbi:MAG TPA: hypothetical protein VFX51_22455 [Solirubrobacteraceae bacterium]|nr:hypothetical protein [Solirubrobacteraceae bacterium]